MGGMQDLHDSYDDLKTAENNAKIHTNIESGDYISDLYHIYDLLENKYVSTNDESVNM